MSGKCRKIMYALVVTVFAAFLWMICCENDRKVSDKAIGETTVQSMRSGEKSVSLEQSDIPKIEIEDLTDAFTVILQYASKDMLAGCTVDESFLMWFYAQYGRDAVMCWMAGMTRMSGMRKPEILSMCCGCYIAGTVDLDSMNWKTYIGCRQRLPRKWYLDSPVILISQRTGIQPSI